MLRATTKTTPKVATERKRVVRITERKRTPKPKLPSQSILRMEPNSSLSSTEPTPLKVRIPVNGGLDVDSGAIGAMFRDICAWLRTTTRLTTRRRFRVALSDNGGRLHSISHSLSPHDMHGSSGDSKRIAHVRSDATTATGTANVATTYVDENGPMDRSDRTLDAIEVCLQKSAMTLRPGVHHTELADGMCYDSPHSSSANDGETSALTGVQGIVVHDVVVNRALRRRGLASCLLVFLLEQCVLHRLAFVVGRDVTSDNARAFCRPLTSVPIAQGGLRSRAPIVPDDYIWFNHAEYRTIVPHPDIPFPHSHVASSFSFVPTSSPHAATATTASTFMPSVPSSSSAFSFASSSTFSSIFAPESHVPISI
jgi:hypothetical protein